MGQYYPTLQEEFQMYFYICNCTLAHICQKSDVLAVHQSNWSFDGLSLRMGSKPFLWDPV